MTASASFSVLRRYSRVAGALLVGCSLQNFDYLSEGQAPANSAGSAGTSGGTQSSQGGSEAGGATGGDAGGGTENTAGAGAESTAGGAGHGEGGMGAVGGEGGDPGGGGTGAVGELLNPSFENASTSGWTVDPNDALVEKYLFVQWPVGAGSVPEGEYELSTWHDMDAFTVELRQTILGIADGTYTFKGYFSRGDGFNSVTLFARDCGGTDPEPVPVPVTADSQWLAVELSGIEVVGGACEVGLRIDSNPNNWLNADLFSFEPEELPQE